MKKPDWQISFRDLPEIPKSKRWIENGRFTPEILIIEKMRLGYEISIDEEITIRDLTNFYKILDLALEKLDYKTFTTKDFINFRNYIKFAYNYIIILANKIEIYQLYRIVINEHIIKLKQSITKQKFLTYPPNHIVKKINRYNRANTPNTTIFYGSETIDGAINELKQHINIGDLITVSKWIPTRKAEFISYPISHSKQGYGINFNSTKALHGYIESTKKQNKLLTEFMDRYFFILGKEFSKPNNHHFEYLISSTFSEDILDNPQNKNTNFDIECIVYPSVGNKFKTSNVAVRKDIFRHNFELSKVIEFEITETHFDNQQLVNVESINLVKYKNFRQTSQFKDKTIIW